MSSHPFYKRIFRSENADELGIPPLHPPASLDSVQAVVGVVWDGLTTGTHRSHSCPWSIAKAGDTCNALYNPLFVCYANNPWGWNELECGANTKPLLCYRNGSVTAHFPWLPRDWPASSFGASLGHCA